MRVKWTEPDGRNLPADLTSQTKYKNKDKYRNCGESFVVYAMRMNCGYIWYFICQHEKATYPFWYPSPLFTVEDDRISKYWVFTNNINEDFDYKNYTWAFPEWARDKYFYGQLVEDYPRELEVFKKYKELMYLEFPDPYIDVKASAIDETWVMCPSCIDAWEPRSTEGMIVCPKCNNIMHNPFYHSLEYLITT
jgi:hypothetical protein